MSRSRTSLMMTLGVAWCWLSPTVVTSGAETPACGINATYAAVRSLGIEPRIDYESLLNEKYVSSHQGSTLRNLIDAVTDLGGHAQPFQHRGIASLRCSQVPLILHVRSEGQFGYFNHWWLMLGQVDDEILILDECGSRLKVPVATVLARWDGSGMAVHKNPISLPQRISSSVPEVAFCLLPLVGVVGVTLIAKSSDASRAANLLRIAAGVTIINCFWLVACYQQDLSKPPAHLKQMIQLAAAEVTLPQVTMEEVVNASKAGTSEVVLLDSRFGRDFDAGSIPNAESVPVDLSRRDFIRRASQLPRNRPMFLFCQSEGCTFSDVVAVRLAELGFDDLRIYRGGYREFRQGVAEVQTSGSETSVQPLQ